MLGVKNKLVTAIADDTDIWFFLMADICNRSEGKMKKMLRIRIIAEKINFFILKKKTYQTTTNGVDEIQR